VRPQPLADLSLDAARQLFEVRFWGAAAAVKHAAPRVRPGGSTVEVTLIPEGAGTRVRLAHRGLPSEDSQAGHRHGWDHYMPRLAIVAAGGDAGADPWATPEGTEQD